MKRLVLVLLLIVIAAGYAAADSQWDISINVPYYTGARSSSGDLGVFAGYAFLLPDVKWNYYFGPEWLHFGMGLRLWTLVVESAVYPIISLESNLGNFVLNANLGGGAFLLFGVYNDAIFSTTFLPEFTVAYRLGKKKIFSIGTGVLFLFAPSQASLDNFIFTGTAFARWTF